MRGGWSLIAATLLFAAVFSYLAAAFNYPDVLDGPAADVLPALLALGTPGRIVWIVYGLIPLLLIPTGSGVAAATRSAAPALGRTARWFAIITAGAMMIGLLRWPSLHWTLAQSWVAGAPAEHTSIAATFASANLYLGNVIGEFVGELFLNGFFLVAALGLAKATARPWLAYAGGLAAVLGWIAMMRNLTTAVSAVADLNNAVMPLWMLVLGIALLTSRARRV